MLLRGDDQLNETKCAGVLGTTQFRPAEAEEILRQLGAHPGSLGAVAVSLRGQALPVVADEALRGGAGMTTGANEDGFHFRHVSIDRDIRVSRWADLRTVRAGELCVATGQPLNIRRAIEVGHVFKLGTRYSEKLNAFFLDEHGQSKPCIMGCYGIGVTRTMQAVIEQCNDRDGIVWPLALAPYTVCITPLGVAPGSHTLKVALEIYASLRERGVEVILDDRDERPGVKFKDADLVGFPFRIAIGEKSLARGEVEIKPRGGTVLPVAAGQAVDRMIELLHSRLCANPAPIPLA
jgi:prolyl-tRNA synthetase